MKRLRPLCLAALISLPAFAQDGAGLNGAGTQELMQRMFDPQATAEQLTEVLKKAGAAGVPRQQIIEAKLIWGLRRQDNAWLEKMLPELEILAANFSPAEAAVAKSPEEVRSFIAYIKAVLAMDKNDEATFKAQILEAVWLNPSQAQLFTQIIQKQRQEAKMANIKVDMGRVITTHDGEATTLADQVSGKKALLLDFWASWCGPCMRLMPELKKKAEQLHGHGIVVAGMNKDDENAQAVTAKIRDDQEITFPWLIEPAERPFSRQLEIESIPRMILLSPEGQVLFNGHPQDPALWVTLKKIDASIEAPKE